jgi:AcrR family transcriptional regulator
VNARRPYRLKKRAQRAEETRLRIVEATLALHAQSGIAAVGVRDIAEKAAVGIGTVYHHFPTYDDVIRGCAQRVQELTRPPDAAIFDGLDGLDGRLRVLVRQLFAYYARYHWFGRTRCDRNRMPLVELIVSRREQHIEELVREALRPIGADDRTVTIVVGLTDFGVYESLARRGVPETDAAAGVTEILLGGLAA